MRLRTFGFKTNSVRFMNKKGTCGMHTSATGALERVDKHPGARKGGGEHAGA